jgi:hypothetical protein
VLFNCFNIQDIIEFIHINHCGLIYIFHHKLYQSDDMGLADIIHVTESNENAKNSSLYSF